MTAEQIPGRVNRIALALSLILGAMDAWFFRDWNLNPDGVSYLDLARAVASHGIPAVVNGYWSPLYPATLGAVLRLLSPNAVIIYPLVRIVGYLLFVGATFAFSRLLRIATSGSPGYHAASPGTRTLVLVAAWELYLLLVLKSVGLFLVTPDMGVALFVFWECGELVALATMPLTSKRWTRFGIVLAIGFWWKAILFPVSGVMLLVAGWIAWRRRDGWRGPIAAGSAFTILALLFIVPLSLLVGRPTFGETGRLNQLWFVNEAPHLTTLCIGPGKRLPLGRVGIVRTDSVLIARPLTCALPERWPDATLPLWYDASYWYQQTHTYMSFEETTAAVKRDIGYMRDALADAAPLMTVAFALLAIIVLVTRSSPSSAWPLVVLTVIPISFYLLVYVELRHIVPFLVAGAVAALLAIINTPSRWRRALLGSVVAIGAVDCAMHLSLPALIELSIFRHELRGDPRPAQLSDRVARLLAARGIEPGSRVATINTLWNVDWAQRAGVLVRAYTPEYTVPPVQSVVELRDPCTAFAYDQALRGARIDAVVMLAPLGVRVPAGFEPLGDTGYFVRLIRDQKGLGCGG